MTRFPSLFVSHGSPMMALEDSRARRFLCELGAKIGKPDAILVASAHWEAPQLAFTTAEMLPTIHDFGGFPQALHDCQYVPPGAPDAVSKAAALLQADGMEVYADPVRGVDHGTWVPLMLMYPDADVPVAQISIQTRLGAAHQVDIGRALAPLRDDGILIIGSGNITHNLREMNRAEPDGAGHDWVVEFGDLVADALANGRIDDLVGWEANAPHARRSHPSDEHFLPLFTALGAGGLEARAERIHSSYSYGSLAMDMYSFG
jgi:4,5-DOPA dioxygenase extradiol